MRIKMGLSQPLRRVCNFTDRLFAKLDEKNIERHFVTLHVGAGTFLPVKAEDTKDHKMHAEWGEISPELADKLNAVHARGNRIIAVGTTSLPASGKRSGRRRHHQAFLRRYGYFHHARISFPRH